MTRSPDALLAAAATARLPMAAPHRLRGGWRLPWVMGLACGLLFLPVSDAAAQVDPDSVVVGDTTGVGPPELDSLGIPVMDLEQELPEDSVSADTIFYNLPRLDEPVPAGWARGIWSWDHAEIMASGAVTLAELVAEVPGVVTLLGGDYGTPAAFSAFGSGGGGYRVIRDGFEVSPLSGGVMDLQRIGLAGVQHVRLERRPGEMVLHLRSFEFEDGRPYSLVEAGTGEFDTNFFRGIFADPVALGGDVALGIERTDTQGPGAQEPGNRNSAWVRYQWHRGDDTGLALDFRRAGRQTDVEVYPSEVTRTDWTLRGRHRLTQDLVLELYTGNSTHAVDDDSGAYVTEGGSRRQHGARVAFDRNVQGADIWARGAFRLFGGELPGNRADVSGGVNVGGVGGVSGRAQRASWDGNGTRAVAVQGWTEPFYGLSVFGSWSTGRYGARTGALQGVEPPEDTTGVEEPDAPQDTTGVEEDPLPLFGITERESYRVGAQLQWRGAMVSGALLRVKADSLLPLGLEMDRGQPVLAGAERKGWEVWGSVPVPIMEGLRLKGSLQQWEAAGPYLPEQIYRGAFVYHKVLMESGNAELWWSLGVRGRDPMPLHGEANEVLDEESGETLLEYPMVPFFQSWYARIQIRIVSMHIFITWENFTRRPNLQDFPDRVLPVTRSSYGIRWTLWN